MILEEDPVELAFANIFSYLAGAYAAGGCFADYLTRYMTTILVPSTTLGLAFFM